MGTLFDPRDRGVLRRRLDALTPEHRPRWGRMTAPQMVCHLGCALRQGLGELEGRPMGGPVAHWPVNWLLIHVLPWPKGRATSPPEFLATSPTTWERDVATLRELVERFAARGPGVEWPPSLVFGRISGRSWGVLQHKHFDHHLRQFGV